MSYILLYALKQVMIILGCCLIILFLIELSNRLDRSKAEAPMAIDLAIILAIIVLSAIAFWNFGDAYNTGIDAFEYSLYDNRYAVGKCRPAILEPGKTKDRLFCDKTYYLVYASARDRALVRYMIEQQREIVVEYLPVTHIVIRILMPDSDTSGFWDVNTTFPVFGGEKVPRKTSANTVLLYCLLRILPAIQVQIAVVYIVRRLANKFSGFRWSSRAAGIAAVVIHTVAVVGASVILAAPWPVVGIDSIVMLLAGESHLRQDTCQIVSVRDFVVTGLLQCHERNYLLLLPLYQKEQLWSQIYQWQQTATKITVKYSLLSGLAYVLSGQ